jgi:hypothetical protein
MSDNDQPHGVDEQQVIGSEPAAPTTKSETENQQAVKDYSHTEADGQLSMKVKVHSPFRDYYEGPAFSVTAENDTGPFDILPRHHNFISLLNACDLTLRTVKDGEQKIRISGGIMHVKADQVIVFLDV